MSATASNRPCPKSARAAMGELASIISGSGDAAYLRRAWEDDDLYTVAMFAARRWPCVDAVSNGSGGTLPPTTAARAERVACVLGLGARIGGVFIPAANPIPSRDEFQQMLDRISERSPVRAVTVYDLLMSLLVAHRVSPVTVHREWDRLWDDGYFVGWYARIGGSPHPGRAVKVAQLGADTSGRLVWRPRRLQLDRIGDQATDLVRNR